MAIPGVTPELPLRAKIRVGEKNSSGHPTALDHFICDDPAFAALAGEKPKTIRIRFPYATVEECFPSGLEKWMRSRSGTQILGCYTKGDGIAHRLGKTRDSAGLIILDPTPGSSRQDMPCAAQACPYYGPGPKEGCRPQARLNFFLDGDSKVDSVFRFETKSLNTYEEIAGVLAQYPDLRGRVFELSAERRKKQTKQFTVVVIRELAGGDRGAPSTRPPADTPSPRQALKDWLVERERWPMTPEQIEWVKQHGPEVALAKLVEKEKAA